MTDETKIVSKEENERMLKVIEGNVRKKKNPDKIIIEKPIIHEGSRFSIRIPSLIEDELNLKEGDRVIMEFDFQKKEILIKTKNKIPERNNLNSKHIQEDFPGEFKMKMIIDEDIERRIINKIHKNRRISLSKLAEEVGVHGDTIRRIIPKLEKLKIVICYKRGPKKTRTYCRLNYDKFK